MTIRSAHELCPRIMLVIMFGIFSSLLLLPIGDSNAASQNYTAVKETSNASNIIISDTPDHSALPSPIRKGTITDLTVAALGAVPQIGLQIRVWDPAIAGLQPAVGTGCNNFGTNPPPPPGTEWILRADSAPTDGIFDVDVAYILPTIGDSATFRFGSGVSIVPQLGGVADTIPSVGSGADFAWVNVQSGLARDDDTDVTGQYKFGTCGIEGPSLTQNFRGETTFDAVDPCTQLTKSADDTTVFLGDAVKYRYEERHCGLPGSSPIIPLSITDLGEDANNNGVLEPEEDLNHNGGTPDLGCTPDDRDSTPSDGFNDGDTNTNGILDPGETWIFECTLVMGVLGIFNNTAFATGIICLDADCSDIDGFHTGDPTCQEDTLGQLCDSDERDSEEVEVVERPRTGTIVIKKNTVPDDPQDFSFTHNITSKPPVQSPFKLDDDPGSSLSNTKNFLEVPAGSYRVTETIVKEIPLRNIICTEDVESNSGRNGNSAEIELEGGEMVICTFKNGILVPLCGDGIIAENQPEDAISMTSIRNGNIVKTIHAEKQIFNCELPQGDIPVIADVTIFAEIYEDLNTKSIVSKQVEVVTCIKLNSTGAMLECNLSIPSQDRIPVTNCTESPLEHPQEMNTIRKGGTAKTIETQKEVFICTFADGPDSPTTPDPNDKKVDLVLFTEIYQNLNTLESPDLTMLSMKCVIKIDTVQVEACNFRQVNS